MAISARAICSPSMSMPWLKFRSRARGRFSISTRRRRWRPRSADNSRLQGCFRHLALRYELGCSFAAIALALLQALVLSLRIADGLGQHLAKLVLGLCGFPFGWLPCCHL